jgi:hypothetical protein
VKCDPHRPEPVGRSPLWGLLAPENSVPGCPAIRGALTVAPRYEAAAIYQILLRGKFRSSRRDPTKVLRPSFVTAPARAPMRYK